MEEQKELNASFGLEVFVGILVARITVECSSENYSCILLLNITI